MARRINREQAIRRFWVAMDELGKDNLDAHAYLEQQGYKYPYLSALNSMQLAYLLEKLTGRRPWVSEDSMAYKILKAIEPYDDLDWDYVIWLTFSKMNKGISDHAAKNYSFYHLDHSRKWVIWSIIKNKIKKIEEEKSAESHN